MARSSKCRSLLHPLGADKPAHALSARDEAGARNARPALAPADSFKGQLPVGFIVLKAGVKRSHEEIINEVVKMVRDQIGPVAAFKQAVVVDRLPKTRSGKILRGTMQKIADNEPWKMPATIDDPAILEEITQALESIGYAHSRA